MLAPLPHCPRIQLEALDLSSNRGGAPGLLAFCQPLRRRSCSLRVLQLQDNSDLAVFPTHQAALPREALPEENSYLCSASLHHHRPACPLIAAADELGGVLAAHSACPLRSLRLHGLALPVQALRGCGPPPPAEASDQQFGGGESIDLCPRGESCHVEDAVVLSRLVAEHPSLRFLRMNSRAWLPVGRILGRGPEASSSDDDNAHGFPRRAERPAPLDLDLTRSDLGAEEAFLLGRLLRRRSEDLPPPRSVHCSGNDLWRTADQAHCEVGAIELLNALVPPLPPPRSTPPNAPEFVDLSACGLCTVLAEPALQKRVMRNFSMDSSLAGIHDALVLIRIDRIPVLDACARSGRSPPLHLVSRLGPGQAGALILSNDLPDPQAATSARDLARMGPSSGDGRRHRISVLHDGRLRVQAAGGQEETAGAADLL